MKHWSFALIVLLSLGAAAAWLAAVIDVESIVASGLLCSAAGLLLAWVSYRANRRIGLYYGLAAPTIAVVCGCVIALLEWGPHEAQLPVSVALLVVTVLYVPAAGMAIGELSKTAPSARQPIRLQFRVRALLLAMFLVAMVFGLHRLFGQRGSAVGVLAEYALFLGWVLRNFDRAHGAWPGAAAASEPALPEPPKTVPLD